MSELSFSIGQRWISNSEADLGLGLIKNSIGRRVEVFFPAADEQRIYAADNAPLSRVQYSVGEEVKTDDNVRFIITARHELNDCLIYQGHDEQGGEISIHEMDLSSHVHFSQPQDRLLAGQIDKNRQFELRTQALAYQQRLQQSTVFGLLGPRVQLLPHQIYIAHQVSQRFAPRVLLADEVGLGKTIEAGLIAHQQLISGQAERVLIVVPDSLMHQWLVEMLRRFNLPFTIMDNERYQAILDNEQSNPFESAQLILCPLSLLTKDADIYQSVLDADWDMMIVDEAHHLSWSEQDVSQAYRCIEMLAQKIPSLLLLTATPEQLGVESHFARLRLLDPDRFHDLTEFKQQESDYQQVSALISTLQACENKEAVFNIEQTLVQYLDEKEYQAILANDDFEQAKQQIIRSLLDRHGTGRVLFRNTRDIVTGFPQRHLHSYPLSAPADYDLTHSGIDIVEQLQTERLFGDDWLKQDTRVTWLTDWLKQHKQDKILIICAQAETAQQLELYLRVKQGVRTSLFHEGMTLINRDRAAAYFAEDGTDGAQVLICSEIGSEGRNFQFSHHLVLFDLPLNPDLLEQRIGRLDRIGQHHNVHIHVPYYEQSAQQVLVDWYHLGVNAFEHVSQAGNSLFQQIEQDLFYCLHHPQDKDACQLLVAKTQKLRTDIISNLQNGRNRLLELNSCDEEQAEILLADMEEAADSAGLSLFMEQIFDVYGVDQQVHSGDSFILSPGNHMLHDQFPGLPEDGLTATFKRHRALVREDMTFLTWEHPMVQGSLDMVINSDFGNTAFCTLNNTQIKPGTLLLEAVFKLHCTAPKNIQITRYLSDSYLRIVIDEKGKDYSDILPERTFNQEVGRIPTITKQELVKHTRDNIATLIKQATDRAQQQEAGIIASSLERVRALLEPEEQRLHALAKINPAIRPEELEHLVQKKQLLNQLIAQAGFTLDAIRVAVVK